VESVLAPRENEVVVFEDFFVASLRIPQHPVLLVILRKFQVQWHQLMPNGIIQISKFIWVVTSYRGRPMSYIIRIKRFIWKGLRLPSLHSLGVYLFIHHGLGISGLVTGMLTGFTDGYPRNRKLIFKAKRPIH
jgi:hypothetical protein